MNDIKDWFCRCENSEINHNFKTKTDFINWYSQHKTIFCYPYLKGGLK